MQKEVFGHSVAISGLNSSLGYNFTVTLYESSSGKKYVKPYKLK